MEKLEVIFKILDLFNEKQHLKGIEGAFDDCSPGLREILSSFEEDVNKYTRGWIFWLSDLSDQEIIDSVKLTAKEMKRGPKAS